MDDRDDGEFLLSLLLDASETIIEANEKRTAFPDLDKYIDQILKEFVRKPVE